MRILQHVKFFGSNLGGVERVVEELVPELNRYDDCHVDVLCQGPERRDFKLPQKGMVHQAKTTIFAFSTGLSWQDYSRWRKIRGRYDIVHVHAPWPQSNLNLLLADFPGPVVLHWHADIVQRGAPYLLYRPLERWLLKRADKICVTSPKLLAESTTLEGFKHKAAVVPIGIREAEYPIGAEEIRSIQAAHGRRPIIFALGRLVPYKGFDILIRAAVHLRHDAIVLLAGDGPLEERLAQLTASIGAGHCVRMLGRLTNWEVEAYMQASDIFCLPSIYKSEAFGIVQLEAMRAGRPVVSSRLTGSGVDWVNENGRTGYTVPPSDPIALGNALNSLLDSTMERQGFGANARRRFEALFTARGAAEETRKIYADLLAARGHPA